MIREAEDAAGVLLCLTTHPFGHRRWINYHARFRAKYGPGATVPLLVLLADSGLGLPDGFFGAPPGPGGRMLTRRDETLLTSIQQATMDGREEIVLTEPMIRSLAAGDLAGTLPPPRAELAFQVLAPSAEALAAGAFRLVVTAAPRPGASMAGRFADVLPDAERDRLARGYEVSEVLDAEDPGADADAVAAQFWNPSGLCWPIRPCRRDLEVFRQAYYANRANRRHKPLDHGDQAHRFNTVRNWPAGSERGPVALLAGPEGPSKATVNFPSL